MNTRLNPKNTSGSVIILGHHGLLITGPSGSGKTTLCHRLIGHWQVAEQFATWVGDDQVVCNVFKNKHVANVVPNIAGLTERRFSGINKINHQKCAVLDLEVCLVPHSQLERLPAPRTSVQHENLVSIDAPERDTKTAIELIIDRLKLI